MKIKNLYFCRKWLLLPLILLMLCVGGIPARAQEDDPPLDDAFINALVIMSVNHDMMAGQNEIQNLRALKDYVDQYYEDRLAVVSDSDSISRLTHQQIELTLIISQKIVGINEQNDSMIDFFIDLFSTADDNQGNAQQTTAQRWQMVSGSNDPPAEYIDSANAVSAVNLQNQVTVSLDTDNINTYPSLAPAIADSSDWSYNVPTITDSTSPISPSSSGNDGSGGADFWGDASSGDDDSGIGGDSSAPISGGNDEMIILYKPMRFVNHGFEPVTVLVETYDPAPGYEGVPFPTASTVVFQESNSTAYLDLPLGTYTFCYYWQLDEDYNNDDYFDYHHRTTATFSLNENSSDNINAAPAVGLTPDSVVSNPNGKCGESAPQSQGQNTSGLTPEEQANEGNHTYYFEGLTGNYQFDFAAGQVVWTDYDRDIEYVFYKTGTNTYLWTVSYADPTILVFMIDGFTLQTEGSDYIGFYGLQP